MSDKKTKRKRSAPAYAVDTQIQNTCNIFLQNGVSISARSVAKKLGKAPSTISRDPIRSKLIADAKRQQLLIVETTKRQTKRSRKKDAEVIAVQGLEIERLKRQNNALLTSHKALYNVIREIGGVEAWERFFATAEAVRTEIIDLGATGD